MSFRTWTIFVLVCTLILISCGNSDDIHSGPIPAPDPEWQIFCRGVDLSYVNEIEDFGGKFYSEGSQIDPFQVLRESGANIVRVRLWYDPQWLVLITGGKMYSDLPDVENTIRRAKEAGMAVCLDLHYSDTWADPDYQETPLAWQGTDLSGLRDSVYQYTFRVLTYFKSQGLTPEMVQIGNETNTGMLFPLGEVSKGGWSAFGLLLNAGIRAVRDFSAGSDSKPWIVLHVAQFQNARWWIDQVVNNANVTDFDVLGISHYCKWSTINNFSQISILISDIIHTYNKKVMVMETAYPWTTANADQYPNIFGSGDSLKGYPLTPEGQLLYMNDLTQAVKNGGGKGVFYWEPAWITSAMPDKWGTGSSWDNVTLFDSGGNVLPSVKFLLHQ